MGKYEYTPGPWNYDKQNGWVMSANPSKAIHSIIDDPAFRDADGYLIAAAPELLEALELTRDKIAYLYGQLDQGNSDVAQQAIRKADHAIAKAKGQH